jgi:hypothetical protein
MSMDLATLFPNASADFLAKNSSTSAPTPQPMRKSATLAKDLGPTQTKTLGAVQSAPKAKGSLKPSGPVLNKTEAKFRDCLQAQGLPWFGVQCWTLRLGDDCRYTPDFWAMNQYGHITAYEVKGFWRDDARVKIKAAAAQYPMFDFIAAQLVKGEWKLEPIKT